MTIVKICGLTRPVDIAPAIAAGATHLGFIFAPASPRAVTAEEGVILRRVMPNDVTAVGVFKDQTVEEVLQTAQTVGLQWVQLHGGFETRAIATLQAEGLRVIWAAPVAPNGTYGELPENADLILLDTAEGGQFGGTGATFSWQDTPPPSQPFLIAGGINPHNASRALGALSSAGIDLSSGVEAAPGIKSHALLRELGAALHPVLQPLKRPASQPAPTSSEVSS